MNWTQIKILSFKQMINLRIIPNSNCAHRHRDRHTHWYKHTHAHTHAHMRTHTF